MMELTHIIDDRDDLGEPRNWPDVEITIDWLTKKESGTVNVSDLSFVGDANKYIQNYIRQGMAGGVGIFEGIPYKIVLGSLSDPKYTFKGYLDLTEQATVLGGEEITVSLKKEAGEDWLSDVADSFSFAYLHSIGVIKESDYVRVPYVINYVPDGLQLMLLSMSIYMMTKELVENVQAIAEGVADIIDASTPVIGVSVGLGAGAVTAWDLGNYVMAGLKLAARIAYAIAIVIAIKKLVEELFEQLMPKKRYHLGMRFSTMAERMCDHLGLTLKSPLLQEIIKDWVYIPSKDRKGGDSGEFGYPRNSDAIYLGGDFIRTLKQWFNADFRIIDNVFYFGRRDGFKTASTYLLPDNWEDQERLLDKFQYNTQEMISNYNILYATDVQDQNTLDDQAGRVFQAVTSAIKVNNRKLVNIKGLSQISIPFSMGKEKTELTQIEKVLRDLGKVVDKVTGVFGGGTNFASKIENRIGSLLLSSHFLTTGKIVVMSGDRLANNQRDLISTNWLWDNFHYINSFADYKGEHNQYIRRFEVPVKMTIDEFAVLLTTNEAVNNDGKEYEIEKVVYKPFYGTAKLDYRTKQKYSNNLKVTIV